jgi:triosephosphate isomerase (TIM)
LTDRESGETEAVLSRQFRGGIALLSPDQFARIAIAYEPLWAVGTGKTATPEIDGVLVGSASPDANSFASSVNF